MRKPQSGFSHTCPSGLIFSQPPRVESLTGSNPIMPNTRSARISLGLTLLAALLRTNRAPASEIIFEQGIEYSNPNDERLLLNLARPKDVAGKCPAVLCIHGGGFRAGNRER